jgi:hypothetical protein
VDTKVGDNNSAGVFDGDNPGAAADNDDFDYQELLHHVEPQVLSSMGIERGFSNMDILEKSSKNLLYDESNGCGKEFTLLCVTVELLKLKACHGWSDNSFSKLLSLLAKLLPKSNTLATSTYREKAYMSVILRCGKIHASPNYCILYRKEYEFNTKCLVCGVS